MFILVVMVTSLVLRDDPEYRVAMELEVWRAEQEDLFIKQVVLDPMIW